MRDRSTRTLVAALTLSLAVLSGAPFRPTRAHANVPGVNNTPTPSCVGLWTGVGRNPGQPPWTIVMRVNSDDGTVCGTIEYPSLGCGGALTHCTTRSGQSTFVEHYDHNAGRCAPDGTIVARCNGTAMQWTWVGEEVVQSMLQRR